MKLALYARVSKGLQSHQDPEVQLRELRAWCVAHSHKITAEYVDRAKTGDLDAIVQTYDDMLGKAIKRIVEWTLKTGAEADAKAKAASAPRS